MSGSGGTEHVACPATSCQLKKPTIQLNLHLAPQKGVGGGTS